MSDAESRRALYETLVAPLQTELFRYCVRRCGNRYQAEDLVQETLVEAWRSLDRLRHSDAARPWLFQILRHVVARDWRRRRRQPTCDLVGVEGLQIPAELPDTLSLQEALDQLTPVYREAVVLTMEGFRCAEVAAMQRVPLGTILSRLHRARQKLRGWEASTSERLAV